MPEQINFTKAGLALLPVPAKGKRAYYHDAKTKGLIVQVTSTGNKTFYVYRWVGGRPERIRLGAYPDLTIEQARRQAATVNGEIAQGRNPNDKTRALRDEMTLKELFDLYLDRYAKVHKRSWENDKAQFDRYLAAWAKRKLSGIRKADVQSLHARTGRESGIYAANRLLALLNTLFNKATDWGWEQANPAQGVKKFKEQSRERFLQADELARFFKALADEQNETARDYFLISLLTGARRSNVLAMRWDEVNLERSTWTIPETKNGQPHTVPLVTQAKVILEQRKAAAEGPWVFPGTGSTGHLVEPKKAWARILEHAGIEDLRIHDLRRSLGSWQAATGANLLIIGKTLAHKNPSTTAIYARLNIDPVRDAIERATSAMFEAAGLASKIDAIAENEPVEAELRKQAS